VYQTNFCFLGLISPNNPDTQTKEAIKTKIKNHIKHHHAIMRKLTMLNPTKSRLKSTNQVKNQHKQQFQLKANKFKFKQNFQT
jgi:hypothetical protein